MVCGDVCERRLYACLCGCVLKEGRRLVGCGCIKIHLRALLHQKMWGGVGLNVHQILMMCLCVWRWGVGGGGGLEKRVTTSCIHTRVIQIPLTLCHSTTKVVLCQIEQYLFFLFNLRFPLILSPFTSLFFYRGLRRRGEQYTPPHPSLCSNE